MVVAYCGYIEVCSFKILQMHSGVIYFEGNKFLVQIFTAESPSHYVVTSVLHYRSPTMDNVEFSEKDSDELCTSLSQSHIVATNFL